MRLLIWLKRHVLPDLWVSHEPASQRLVLVAAGEEHVRRLVRANLERQGFRVETAPTGAETLNAARRVAPHVIVVGWHLPDIAAVDLIAALRAGNATGPLPTLALVRTREEAEEFRAIAAGCDCFLTAPFNPMELAAFVRRMTRTLDTGPQSGRLYQT